MAALEPVGVEVKRPYCGRLIPTALKKDPVNHPREDPVNSPAHYTAHASGVECITITEHMNFCVGNAIKYLWRAGLKGDAIEDLEKSRWYIDREIARVKKKKKIAT